MASLFARPMRLAWTPEESAIFAAHRDFELRKLLATADKKVVSMARRMSFAAAADAAHAAAQPASRGPRPPRAAVAAKEAAAAPPACPRKRAKRKRGQLERKMRAAAARKLQALARGFLARRRRLRVTAAVNSVECCMAVDPPAACPAAACAMVSAPSDSPAPVQKRKRSYLDRASSGLEPAAKPDDEWAVHPMRWAEVKRHGLHNENFDQREIANEFYPYARGHRHIRRRSLVLTHRLRKGGS